uniref:KIAA0319 n=1 Tax=Xenopus tropicalis TaxID=8364 RepID=A0A803K4I0_XENTR
MRLYTYLSFLCIVTGSLSEQCQDGATFANAAISPNLQRTHIMRVPNARTMSDCTTACCNQSGCDLSWMLGRRCYIVNCQHKENCEPQKVEHMKHVKSYLTFVLRPSARFIPLPLYGSLMSHRGYPLEENDESDEDIAHFKELSFLNKNPSFLELADYNEEYSDPKLDFLPLSDKVDQKENHDLDYLGWILPETEHDSNSTAVEIGRRNEKPEEGLMEEPTVTADQVTEPSLLIHIPPTVIQAGGSMSDSTGTNDDAASEPTTILPIIIQTLPFVTERTTIQEIIIEPQTLSTNLSSAAISETSVEHTVIPPTTAKKPFQHLTVSTETEILVVLPKNEVELNAVVAPEAPTDMPYSFEWSLIHQPVDYQGQLNAKHARTPKLSQLSPGMYILKVSVSNLNSFGEGYINVTVKPARVNQPPVAIVSPKALEMSFPTTSAIIDGRQSTDDGKIATYLWEEIEGPGGEPRNVGDSPVLHLTELITGNHTFRLTVTDNEGAINSTTAYITVSKPADYPPVANAGPDQVITLPQNAIILNGNMSSDDQKIVSYEWSLSPSSKGKVVAMQSVHSPYLQVSAMQVGKYTFELTVTDLSGQRSSDNITVTVQPEPNTPPVAVTSPYKELILPMDSTILDGSRSRDDEGITAYKWEYISGPSKVTIQDSDKPMGLVTGLQVGVYTFHLTVKDQQGLSSTATHSVTVKKEKNSPPKACAGGTHILVLPDNSISLDGSKSFDDQGIVSYLWKRDAQSPAAGDIMHSSDHDPILQLTNLVDGIYIFHLTVTDAKGETDVDTATVEVRPDPRKQNLVELILQVGVGKLTEQQKDTLVRQLALLLNVLDTDIKVQKIAAHSDLSTVILFYVQSGHPLKVQKAANVAQTLQDQLLKEKADFLLYKVLRVDTAEWSVLYIAIVTFAMVAFLMGIVWLCICCCQSQKRTKIRKKTKYTILDNIDEQEKMELTPKYGIKHRSTAHNSSLMVSESEFESDQDTIFSREKLDRENPKTNGIGAFNSGIPFNFSSQCR